MKKPKDLSRPAPFTKLPGQLFYVNDTDAQIFLPASAIVPGRPVTIGNVELEWGHADTGRHKGKRVVTGDIPASWFADLNKDINLTEEEL